MENALAGLLVYVENAAGEPVADATLELIANTTKDRSKAATMEPPGQASFTQLPPGDYELRVSHESVYQPETRLLTLGAGDNTASVILGEPGQPYFYAGDTKVYFQPDERTVLVTARGENAAEITPKVLSAYDLDASPVSTLIDGGDGTDGQLGRLGETEGAADSSFLAATLRDGQTVEEAGELLAAVTRELRGQGLQPILALPVYRGAMPVQGLTDELAVRFRDDVVREEAEGIAKEFGLRVERPILYAGNAYLLRSDGPPSYRLLEVAETLRREGPVIYAEPTILQQLQLDFIPNDTLWNNLTHLPLIDCDDAWDTLAGIDVNRRGGSANITIAVFDPNGVTPNHPDLTGNLTDGTAKLVTSFNFSAMAAQTVAGLSGDHGTQCAGTATAVFNNNQGTAGLAPNCHLIGARLPNPATGIEMADAFVWAAGFNTGNTTPGFPALPARPADVISNSWGANGVVMSAALRDCFDFLTVYGRGGRGCVTTFSLGNNGHVPFATGTARRDYAAYERNIAVGASINTNPTNPVATSFHAAPNGATTNIATAVDTRALYSPFGPALDIVAPSHTTYNAAGNLVDATTSTTRVGLGPLDGCPGATVCNDYGTNFGGTSHSSPTIAGAAALVLSVNAGLSWVQVREILRTTAVRIDNANTNPIGLWVDNDGDGVAEFSQWYGYGRVDVRAAVIRTRDLTMVADIVVRENLADTGAVPSTGWHAHSPDIWVRRADDPIPTLAYTADPPHQNPRRGQSNYVFCRVRNNGTAPSNEVYIRAMITHYPGFEFRYPQEFVPTNRPGDPLPSPLRPGTYLIGEVRIDNLAAGANQIVKITWPAAAIPPETVVVGGVSVRWHPCLLLEASPHDGPLSAGATIAISRDNNIAQRNLTILNPGDPATDLFSAVVVGSFSEEGVSGLLIDRSELDRETHVVIRFAESELMDRLIGAARRLGLELGHHQEVDVVEIPAKERFELPLHLASGEFGALMVAMPRNGADSKGELRLTQRLGTQELSAGYGLQFATDVKPERPSRRRRPSRASKERQLVATKARG